MVVGLAPPNIIGYYGCSGGISILGVPTFANLTQHQFDAVEMRVEHIKSILRCNTKIIVAASHIVVQYVRNVNNDSRSEDSDLSCLSEVLKTTIKAAFDSRLFFLLSRRTSNDTVRGRAYQDLAQQQILFLEFLCLWIFAFAERLINERSSMTKLRTSVKSTTFPGPS